MIIKQLTEIYFTHTHTHTHPFSLKPPNTLKSDPPHMKYNGFKLVLCQNSDKHRNSSSHFSKVKNV